MDAPLLDLRLPDALPAGVGVDSVVSTLRGLGVDDDTIRRSAAVVGELIVEARARVAFSAETAPVAVIVRLAGDRIVLQVHDQRAPNVEKAAADRLSWKLARLGFVSALRTSLDDDGNITECDIARPRDDAWLFAERGLAEDDTTVDDATAAAVAFRDGSPADALQIMHLAFRTYGFTYADESFYSEAAVALALESGRMRSQVAVAPDGEVVGHLATVCDPTDRIPEFGRLMVDPRWRRHRLAATLGRDAIIRSRELGDPALWAEAVANHVGSQRLMLAAGGVEVGLLVGAAGSDVTMARLDTTLHGRMSLIAYALPLNPGPSRPAYVPAHHREMYLDLVARLGLSRTVSDSDERSTGSSEIQVSVSAGLGTGRISILRPGPDAAVRVSEEVAVMAASQLSVIYLDIPLFYPSAARSIRRAESNGFFWAALLPNAREGGDVVRMQQIGWVEVDTANVNFSSEHGERMANYVLAERKRVDTPAPPHPPQGLETR